MKSGITIDGRMETIKIQRRSHLMTARLWTPETINEVVTKIVSASSELLGAVQSAVSPKVMALHHTLAWEERRLGEQAT